MMIRIAIVLLILPGMFLLNTLPAFADSTRHVVQPGETLFRIALNYGITVEALRAANGIVGNTIYAGQVLVIPDQVGQADVPRIDQVAVSSTSSTHIVQRGENLYRIGLRYGVSVSALQAANNLVGNVIHVGQQLIIPARSSVAPATTTPSPATVPLLESSSTPRPPAVTSTGKRFVVDISEQTLYAFEGDTLVRTTLVSTGLPATPTVIGTFYIYLRYPSQRMVGPGYDLPNVPYVQYFYKDYGLHGTYWHNNFGQPMSHGCVNLPTPEAEWAYNWATYGTPVTVQP